MQVLGVLSRSDLDPNSPVKAKISIVTSKGCRAGKIFVGMRLFSCKRKPRKKCFSPPAKSEKVLRS